MVDRASPIHTAAVGLGDLRFFRSPLEGPRFPWFAVSDLFACLSMDQGHRRYLHAKLKRNWRDDVRMVWTETGETMIAPQWVAQGLIRLMVEVSGAPASLEKDYIRGAKAALRAITFGLSAVERANYSVTAYCHETGVESEVAPLRNLGGGLIG